MKTARIIVILFLAICLPFVADSEDRTIKRNKPSETSERRTALVIGNSNYASSPLKNPANDARDMAKALEELGFTVIHKENAGLRDMEKAVNDFEKQLRQGGAGLFYYAGHGIQVKGSNYLIPTDAEIETESDVRYKAMDAGQVLGKMEDAGNGLNIVILDACRNNPFGRSFRSAQQGLAQMDAPAGSVVIFATGPNSVAADGAGRNGTFTKHLLTHIKTPGLKLEDVAKSVRRGVAQDTGNKQIPWEHSSLMGDFYFASSGAAVYEQPVKPATSASPTKTTLSVKCNVNGAWVFTGDKSLGQTPINNLDISAGEHLMIVVKEGYETYQKQIRVERGDTVSLQVELSRKEQAASAPVYKPSAQAVPKPKYQLRKELMTISDDEAYKVFKSRKEEIGPDSLRFSIWRPLEYIENDFRDNGDGTITDYSTGLMWQKHGTEKERNYENAKVYIEEVNREKFAGYSDWRLPTIDELKSLMTSKEINGSHINQIFDKAQENCWTSDMSMSASGFVWYVAFMRGVIFRVHSSGSNHVRAVRSLQ